MPIHTMLIEISLVLYQSSHHPPVTSVHQEPTAVLAKAPKISGYAYTSEVRHDAPVKAIAHAPVVAHAGKDFDFDST